MKSKVRTAIALLMAVSLCRSASAQQWRSDRYDTRWLPISNQELQRQVRANARDAVGLYRLWDRARYQYNQVKSSREDGGWPQSWNDTKNVVNKRTASNPFPFGDYDMDQDVDAADDLVN